MTTKSISLQSGFVLLMVLLFLQVFALFGLFGLTETAMMMKKDNIIHEKMVYSQMAENLLTALEKRIMATPPVCTVPITPASVLTKHPETWWKLHACSDYLNEIRYYYIVESMGSDPCGIATKSINNHTLIAHYYRITLFIVLHDRFKGANIYLQSTMMHPSEAVGECHGTPHIVNGGRQMWREI